MALVDERREISAALIVAAAARETEDERREGELFIPVPLPELLLLLLLFSGGVAMVDRCWRGDADDERECGREFKSGGGMSLHTTACCSKDGSCELCENCRRRRRMMARSLGRCGGTIRRSSELRQEITFPT